MGLARQCHTIPYVRTVSVNSRVRLYYGEEGDSQTAMHWMLSEHKSVQIAGFTKLPTDLCYSLARVLRVAKSVDDE
jgi:hypothetical protein